jgi:hypothetical protein
MDDRDVATMSDSELLSALDDTHTGLSVLQTRQTQILDRLEQTGYAKTIGAHDLPRLLSARYRLDLADAGRRVKFAVDLRKYPVVAAALPAPGAVIPEDGVVLHPGQARAIMSALEQIPKSANVPVEELDAAAGQMVEAARHMKPSELQSMGVQVRNILDTDGPEPRENAARERENVWVTKVEDGVKFGGYLAGENAEKLQTVLQAGAKPHKTEDGALDPRPRGKRQADALVDVLDIALASGDLPTRGGIKPHITVTINLNDLLEAGRQATGDLTYGDGLSASAIRRLACDAGIIPVILGSDSQPLDVGREKRYVTDGLRSALNQRDKGCVICHAPPIYCDAHHVVSWADGGVTSLANLVLMCRVDHTSLHDGHWTITIVNNQVQVTRPTWADPPPRTGRRLGQPSTTSATAPAPPATTPWPPPTATAPPPATSDADPWTPPTAMDTAPATTDAASTTTVTDTWPPTAEDPALTTPDADPWPPSTATAPPPATLATDPWPPSTSTAATTGASTDANPATRPGLGWSYVDDIGWISPDDASAIDPWGDLTTEPELCSEAEPPTTPDVVSPDTPGAAGFEPWEDSTTEPELCSEADPPTTRDVLPSDSPGATVFAPWGDSTTEAELCSEAESFTIPDETSSDGPSTAAFDLWADSA